MFKAIPLRFSKFCELLAPPMSVWHYVPYNKLYTLAEYFHWKCLFCMQKRIKKKQSLFYNFVCEESCENNMYCILTVGAQGAFWSISVDDQWPRKVIFLFLYNLCAYMSLHNISVHYEGHSRSSSGDASANVVYTVYTLRYGSE